MEQFKEDPVYGALNGYSQIVLLADALNAAKSDKAEDSRQGPAGQQVRGLERHHQLHARRGPYWQQWTPPMLFTQYTQAEQPFAEVQDHLPAGAQDRRPGAGAEALRGLGPPAWTCPAVAVRPVRDRHRRASTA